jgi:hypothetical protein
MTIDELREENSRLRAAVREVQGWDGVQEAVMRIRAAAAEAVVPDYRAGLLVAAAMLEGES